MKKISTLLAIAALGAGATAAVADATSAHVAGSAAVVGTRSTSLGTILVGTNGHTLYLDTNDTKNKSTCTGGCASVWPALTTSGKPMAKGSAKASDLGTITTAGKKQVTYKGHPLYYFASDSAAGKTTGQAQNGFYVVSPSGASITKSATNKSTSSAGSSTGAGW
jgi:predicted lipoprotein with Yx(FWY)xxD motif